MAKVKRALKVAKSDDWDDEFDLGNTSFDFVEDAASFEDAEPLTAPKKKIPESEYIIIETKIDRFTLHRSRVELTPTQCRAQGCGFDVAKKNGFPRGYHSVPRRERESMIEALAEHVRLVHNRSEDHIVPASAMPKRWLSAEKGV